MKKRCHQQSQNCTLDGTRSSRSDALSFYRKGWNLCFVTKQNNSSPFCCFYSLISRVVCSCFSQPCWSKDPQIPKKCQDKSKNLRQGFFGLVTTRWGPRQQPDLSRVHPLLQEAPSMVEYTGIAVKEDKNQALMDLIDARVRLKRQPFFEGLSGFPAFIEISKVLQSLGLLGCKQMTSLYL